MIKLDDNYTLENNSIHGVELIFREERTKTKKQADSEKNLPKVTETYIFEDRLYFPNPTLALKRWISLTNNESVDSFEELEKLTNKQNEILENIYKEFVKNKRKV